MISLSGGIGSGSNTSSPATMSPRFSRSINASLSTTTPRDTFTNTALDRNQVQLPPPDHSLRRHNVCGARQDDSRRTSRAPAPARSSPPRSRPASRSPGTGRKRGPPPRTAPAASQAAARCGRTRSAQPACRSASPCTNPKSSRCRLRRVPARIFLKLSPAFRSEIRISPSAHSATGYDDPCVVSTVRINPAPTPPPRQSGTQTGPPPAPRSSSASAPRP